VTLLSDTQFSISSQFAAVKFNLVICYSDASFTEVPQWTVRYHIGLGVVLSATMMNYRFQNSLAHQFISSVFQLQLSVQRLWTTVPVISLSYLSVRFQQTRLHFTKQYCHPYIAVKNKCYFDSCRIQITYYINPLDVLYLSERS